MARMRIILGWGLAGLLVLLAFLYVAASYYAETRREAALARIAIPPSVDRFLKRSAALDSEPASEARQAAGLSDSEIDALHQRFADYAALVENYKATLQSDPEWPTIRKSLRDHATWTEERWAQAGALLKEHRGLLDELRRIMADEGPLANTKIVNGRVDTPFEFALCMDFSRLLTLDALVQARAENWEGSVESIIVQSRLGSALATNYLSIYQLLNYTSIRSSMDSIRDSMPTVILDVSQYDRLLECFEDAWNPDGLGDALWLESLLHLTLISDTGLEDALVIIGKNMRRRESHSLPMDDLAESNARVIALARLPYHAAREELALIQSRQSDVDEILFPMLSPNVSRMIRSRAHHEANMGLARVGLRLERHRVVHGAYPESLAAIGEEMGGLPLDPFTGEAYRYVRSGDTFTLYSLGENRVDDGGRHDPGEGDLVWRGREAER